MLALCEMIYIMWEEYGLGNGGQGSERICKLFISKIIVGRGCRIAAKGQSLLQPHHVMDELSKADKENGSSNIMDGALAQIFSSCQVLINQSSTSIDFTRHSILVAYAKSCNFTCHAHSTEIAIQ